MVANILYIREVNGSIGAKEKVEEQNWIGILSYYNTYKRMDSVVSPP